MSLLAKTTAPNIGFSKEVHRLIPGGAHTYSKGDDQLPSNAPAAFVRGKGGRVWDLDGREFVDWGMGINNVLIGHAEDVIDDAAIAAIRNGQSFSRPTPLELEAAEAVLGLFDGFEMIKFAKNGSDVNSAAVRLARAITGHELIAFDTTAPFLATDDWFIGNTLMNAGTAEATARLAVPFRLNDTDSVRAVFAEHPGQIAAVILEPCREIRPREGFLEALRELCDREGALLIFDEVVTAFRYGLHGAPALFGVRPDLMTLGKGMANGYSVTALLGPRQYMERGGLRHAEPRCFLLSTTNGAEQSGLAATVATVEFYRQHDVIGALKETGRRVMEGLTAASRRHGIEKFLYPASDFACRPVFRYLDANGQPSLEYRTLFLQEMLRCGVFMPWVCPCYRHTGLDLEQTLEAFDQACKVYAQAINAGSTNRFLEGPPVKVVLRRFN